MIERHPTDAWNEGLPKSPENGQVSPRLDLDSAETARIQLTSRLECLLKDLRNESPRVRAQAAVGLGRIGSTSEIPSISTHGVEAVLAGMTPDFRVLAEYALGRYRPSGLNAVGALASALQDSDATVRTRAAQALIEFRDYASEAIPALIQALGDADSRVQVHCSSALSLIGDRAVMPLVEAIERGNAEQRRGACNTLWVMSKGASAAVEHLARLSQSEQADVRNAALSALEAIDPAIWQTLIGNTGEQISRGPRVGRISEGRKWLLRG